MDNKYKGLNVLNKRDFLADYKDLDAVNQVSAMVNNAGNRSSRRRIEKALNKTANISAHADKRATERANRELANKADLDLVWMYAIVGITMYEDYRWKENPDNDHGQISSLFDRITKKMNKYNDMGYAIEDVAREFENMTGIQLIAERH